MGGRGDFNMILNDLEKLGRLPISQIETTDFARCINNCSLIEFPFLGVCILGGMEGQGRTVSLRD